MTPFHQALAAEPNVSPAFKLAVGVRPTVTARELAALRKVAAIAALYRSRGVRAHDLDQALDELAEARDLATGGVPR